MPFVNVSLLAGRTAEQKTAVAQAIADALTEHAQAAPGTVAVVFSEYASEDWLRFPGGRLERATYPTTTPTETTP